MDKKKVWGLIWTFIIGFIVVYGIRQNTKSVTIVEPTPSIIHEDDIIPPQPPQKQNTPEINIKKQNGGTEINFGSNK